MHWTTPKRSATNWPCRWRGWKPGGDGKVGIRFGYGSIPINTIFSGMNIHLPAILMFTRGTRFWHTAISFQKSYGKGVVNGLEWPKDVCQKHEFDSNELAEESLPVSGIGRSFFFFFLGLGLGVMPWRGWSQCQTWFLYVSSTFTVVCVVRMSGRIKIGDRGGT